jgi:hypothetical protein
MLDGIRSSAYVSVADLVKAGKGSGAAFKEGPVDKKLLIFCWNFASRGTGKVFVLITAAIFKNYDDFKSEIQEICKSKVGVPADRGANKGDLLIFELRDMLVGENLPPKSDMFPVLFWS